MVSTITILFASVLSLYLVWTVVRPGLPQIKSLEDWESKNHAVDPEMFRTLPGAVSARVPFIPEKAHGVGHELAEPGRRKRGYVNETGATGKDGIKSSVGPGSSRFDPWSTSASCKLDAD